ncbi:ABC transporter permease [Escherichia coli]|uniref:ABC transporter permease n=1 Tax=Escherichia coli TaxID=562 RepID=A0A376KW56_ECOLX|nr:ABC transporter permease [Escherichia coli]
MVAIAGMIGSLLGCLSGVLGGRADAIIMRIMDIMLSIPSLVLTMALAAALGRVLFNAMLAIAIVRIPFYVRLARGQALGCTPVYLCSGGRKPLARLVGI